MQLGLKNQCAYVRFAKIKFEISRNAAPKAQVETNGTLEADLSEIDGVPFGIVSGRTV